MKWPGNSNDELGKFLVVQAGHHAECQQFVDDREKPVEKLCFDAVAEVVGECTVFDLDSTQKCLDNEAVT